jgi:hypothetical protein
MNEMINAVVENLISRQVLKKFAVAIASPPNPSGYGLLTSTGIV